MIFEGVARAVTRSVAQQKGIIFSTKTRSPFSGRKTAPLYTAGVRWRSDSRKHGELKRSLDWPKVARMTGPSRRRVSRERSLSILPKTPLGRHSSATPDDLFLRVYIKFIRRERAFQVAAHRHSSVRFSSREGFLFILTIPFRINYAWRLFSASVCVLLLLYFRQQPREFLDLLAATLSLDVSVR